MTVKARILLLILWLAYHTIYAQSFQEQTTLGAVDLSGVFEQGKWWQASTSSDSKWSQQKNLSLRNRYSSFPEQIFLTTDDFIPSGHHSFTVVDLALDVKLSQHKSRLTIYSGSEQTGEWEAVSALYTSHQGVLRIFVPSDRRARTQLMFEYVADADVNDVISIQDISWSIVGKAELAKNTIKIYPNPINRLRPTFHYQVFEAGEYEIMLMDMSGKSRMKSRQWLAAGTQTLNLPTDLKKGNYYFQLLALDTNMLISKPLSVN